MALSCILYLLSGALAINLFAIARYGARLSECVPLGNYPTGLLEKHRRAAWSLEGLSITIGIAAEGIVVPAFGRHYSDLVIAHLVVCALYGALLITTHLNNPMRSDGAWHNVTGMLTKYAGLTVVITGVLVTTFAARAH